MANRSNPLFASRHRGATCGLGLALLLAACAGATGVDTVGVAAMPAPETRAELAGHRCDGSACTCRVAGQDDVESSRPPAGFKRFEVRVASAGGPVWVVVDDATTLHLGTGGVPKACFYLDLPSPGDHRVSIRGKGDRDDGGIGATVELSEYSPDGPWWYDTFRLQCGVPGPCATEDLRGWAEAVRAYPRGLRDACGSTKIKQVSWDAARAPDGEHPAAFEARFVLNVYDFAPKAGPGGCGRSD